MSWTIRTAEPGDRDAIVALVFAAFSDATRDGQAEVDIVRATWARDAMVDGLELVAAEGDEVLGYVLGARGDLGGREVVGIAPLAVTPPRHGQGVGTALMTEVLRRADAAGLPLVVLLGNPKYYGRFGFEPAGPLGVHYQPVGADNPDFMVHKFAAYDPSYRGNYVYCWERGTTRSA